MIITLITVLFLAAFLLPDLLPTRIVKNTEIRGLIVRNQRWSETITITGDIVTLPGTHIEIDPGTKILIANSGDKFNVDFLPWHLKQGINSGVLDHGVEKGDPFWDENEKISLRFFRLYARGTKDLPIIFTSNSQNQSRFDINLIWIQRGTLDYVQMSHYRKFKIGDHVMIKRSQFLDTDECALCISQGRPQILQSYFKHGYKGYIRVDGGSPLIQGNVFTQNNADSITYWGLYSSVNVVENFFLNPSLAVIRILQPTVDGTIARNYIPAGDIYLPCNPKVQLLHNYIKTRIIFDSKNGCEGTYVIGLNYWDTLQKEIILPARVVGNTDSFRVSIPFILTTPPPFILTQPKAPY